MKVGLISDVHGNDEALARCLEILDGLGVEKVCFLGDAVGYLPGVGAVPILEAACSIRLKGNHEAMLLEVEKVDPYRDRVYQLQKTHKLASGTDILQRIASWPLELSETWGACRAQLVHGSPADPLGGYIYPDTQLPLLFGGEFTHVICAHTHRPFVRKSGDVTWINCGSIGLPRDDGRYGAFAVLDTASGKADICRFDIVEATRRALARVGSIENEVLAVYQRRAAHSLTGEIVG